MKTSVQRDIGRIDKSFYPGGAYSAGGKVWQSRLDTKSENAALHMVQKYGLADIVARVLAARGVSETDAMGFLNPSLRQLMPDPYCLRDMEKAAERLCLACVNHEKIAIFADYDVDGACSAALLARFFTALGVESRIYIPDRLREGYGPNEPALQLLAEEGASLIICADCGAASAAVFAQFKQTAERTPDIIVLDHHLVPKTADDIHGFGDFIHINPNRPDDTSGLGNLCAAGVVFMCLAAVARLLRAKNVANLPDLIILADLVALATVCDMMSLQGLNRAFVKTGLIVAHKQQNLGLQALAQVARIREPLNPYHFGYILGPRINAGGRVGDVSLGAKLLCCNNAAEAEYIAAQLDSLNYGRQDIEAEQLCEALDSVTKEMAQNSDVSEKVIFTCGNWHIGIIGLLAARLKERFSLPAFVMAELENGKITGSVRSIKGVDIGGLIGDAVAAGVLEKGGGHAMAAGFSLQAENVPLFRQWLSARLANAAMADEESAVLMIDGSISAGGVNAEMIEELEKAGPYGVGWKAPIFALPNHTLAYAQPMGKDGAHLRVVLADGQGGRLSAVAFRAADTELGQFLQNSVGKQIHVAGTLSLDHWNGQTTPQLHIIDAAEAN